MSRALGLLHLMAYKANHHFLMHISLRNWLWVLLVIPPAAAWLRRLSWPLAIGLSVLGALLLAAIEWSGRKGYLVFEPGPVPLGARPLGARPLPEIVADEQIQCLASGRFAVGKNERTTVNERALVSFVRTREHVIMVRLERTRFLLLTRSLDGEVGWWYAFFTPRQVQRVETGRLIAGLRAHPALAIQYARPDGARGTETVYLAFLTPDALQRVLEDLRRDVPEQAFGTF